MLLGLDLGARRVWAFGHIRRLRVGGSASDSKGRCRGSQDKVERTKHSNLVWQSTPTHFSVTHIPTCPSAFWDPHLVVQPHVGHVDLRRKPGLRREPLAKEKGEKWGVDFSMVLGVIGWGWGYAQVSLGLSVAQEEVRPSA